MINTFIHKYIFNYKEVTLEEFRKSLAYSFNIILILLFLFYSISFYDMSYIYFANIKLGFSILFILILFYFSKIDNIRLYSTFLGVGFSLYTFMAFFSSAEYHFGFIWSLFIPPTFIFLMSYKRGLYFLMPYTFLIFSFGLLDIYTVKNQFSNYIYFIMFYSTYLGFLFICILIDYSFIKLHNKIVNISITDPLTKLFNRRKIDEVLLGEFKNKNNVSIAILDVDNFKTINDTYGHQAGDEVLKNIAEVLKKNIRSTDTLGRWGGEEFLIIFPQTNLKEAKICIEKIRDKLKVIKYKSIEKITCSFGISFTNNDLNITELIKKADNALYEAKKDGKDKIILSSPII